MATATLLDTLRDQRESLVGEIEGLMGAEDFTPEDPTFVEARAKADSLDSKIKSIVEFANSRDAANQIDVISLKARKEKDVQSRSVDSNLSPGEIWIRSKAYEDYRQAPRGTSGHVEFPIQKVFDLHLQTRASILTSTPGYADILLPDRISAPAAPNLQTPLLDIIQKIQVSSGNVEWPYYPSAAPLAGEVAEGAAKPEATLAPELRQIALATIAHWIQFSRQFAEDAAALRQWIDAELVRGVLDKLEADAATVLTTDVTIPALVNAGTLLEGIRMGIAAVQSAGYQPRNVVMNPADAAALDIDILGLTHNGPVVGTQYWGVSPIFVGAVPSGTAYVGDFGVGMAQLQRSGINSYVTDSHAANFVSNLLVLLVETRAKTIVHRPEAIIKVPGTVILRAADAQSRSGGRVSPPAPERK